MLEVCENASKWKFSNDGCTRCICAREIRAENIRLGGASASPESEKGKRNCAALKSGSLKEEALCAGKVKADLAPQENESPSSSRVPTKSGVRSGISKDEAA